MQGRAHAYCLMVVVRGKAKRQADRQTGNYRNIQMYKTIQIEGEAEK